MYVLTGSIQVTFFDKNIDLNKGDAVILQSFTVTKYKGGDNFQLGEGSRVLVNDYSYECTEDLKKW